MLAGLMGCLSDADPPAPVFESKLALDIYSLEYDSATDSRVVTIRNTGNSFLTWDVNFNREWAKVGNPDGSLDPGDWDTVRITVFPYKMPLGVQNDVVILRNNSKDSLFPLPITVHVGQAPRLEFDAKAFRVRQNHDSALLIFSNVGNAPGTWKVEASDSALRPEKTQITVLAKDKTPLLVRVDRTRLKAPESTFELRLIASGSEYRIPMQVQNLSEERIPFGFEIVHSEACLERRELHFISNHRFENGSAVAAPVYGIWNAGTGVTRLLPLPGPAKRMDMMRDCSLSAIAYPHSVIIVDAVSPKIVRSYPLDTNYTSIDIALTQAGGVYLNSTTPWMSGGYFHFNLANDSSFVLKEAGTGHFTLTPDERYLLEAYVYFHYTWVFDISGNQPIRKRPYSNLDAPDRFFFLEGGKKALDQAGRLSSFDATAARPFQLLKAGAAPNGFKLASEAPGHGMILVSLQESIAFIDSADYRPLYTWMMPFQAAGPDFNGDLPQIRQSPEEFFLSPDGNTLTVLTRKPHGGPYDPKPVYHESFDLKPVYAVIDSLYPDRKR